MHRTAITSVVASVLCSALFCSLWSVVVDPHHASPTAAASAPVPSSAELEQMQGALVDTREQVQELSSRLHAAQQSARQRGPHDPAEIGVPANGEPEITGDASALRMRPAADDFDVAIDTLAERLASRARAEREAKAAEVQARWDLYLDAIGEVLGENDVQLNLAREVLQQRLAAYCADANANDETLAAASREAQRRAGRWIESTFERYATATSTVGRLAWHRSVPTIIEQVLKDRLRVDEQTSGRVDNDTENRHPVCIDEAGWYELTCRVVGEGRIRVYIWAADGDLVGLCGATDEPGYELRWMPAGEYSVSVLHERVDSSIDYVVTLAHAEAAWMQVGQTTALEIAAVRPRLFAFDLSEPTLVTGVATSPHDVSAWMVMTTGQFEIAGWDWHGGERAFSVMLTAGRHHLLCGVDRDDDGPTRFELTLTRGD